MSCKALNIPAQIDFLFAKKEMVMNTFFHVFDVDVFDIIFEFTDTFPCRHCFGQKSVADIQSQAK